jgi:hypothetical protein
MLAPIHKLLQSANANSSITNPIAHQQQQQEVQLKQLEPSAAIDNFEDMVICDKLTEEGFCIRKINEFQPCAGNCNNAIATKSLYDFLVSKGFDKEWNVYCDECK